MNDFVKQAEINQFLMQHSIKNFNPIANNVNKPREDDSVFGGVWVPPEEEVKKNTLSLTGTEIWGPRPNIITEKNASSEGSSVKSTPADTTPEINSEKSDKFLFRNNSSSYFQFPHGFSHNEHTLAFNNAPFNHIQSNNMIQKQQQFRPDVFSSGDEKFKSVWDNKSSGSSSGRVSVTDQDPAVWGNFAQVLNDLNKKSTFSSSSDVSQKDFSSPINQLPEFIQPSAIPKDLMSMEKSFPPSMSTPWSTIVKQSMPNCQEDWLNRLKNNCPNANPTSRSMKDNLGPFQYAPSWDQTSLSSASAKQLLPQQQAASGMWGLANSLINKQTDSNPTNVWNRPLPKDLAVGSQCPVKFDPSVPPPPIPQKPLIRNKNVIGSEILANANIPREQLLDLLSRPLPSSLSSSSLHRMNINKGNLNSQPAQLATSNIFNPLNQAFNVPGPNQIPPMQRPIDLQSSELYRKIARHLYSSSQIPQTRSRMVQLFTNLGFKKETAGKLLIDNGLDFELTLGELVFKTAVSRGLIQTPLESASQLNTLDPSKLLNTNKHGETLQNYLRSLHSIIQQQLMHTQASHDISSSSSSLSSMTQPIQQPQIDYAIQALLNNQDRYTSPSVYMSNFSFTTSNNNEQLMTANLKNLLNNNCNNIRALLNNNNNDIGGGGGGGIPPSFFASPPTLPTSPPFFDMSSKVPQQQQQQQQSKSSSNLNPQSPEWMPGLSASMETALGNSNSNVMTTGMGGFPKQSNDAPEDIKTNNLLTTLNNMKLGNLQSVSSLPLTTTNGITATTTGISLAGISGLSINEFIPGIPWKKDSSDTFHTNKSGSGICGGDFNKNYQHQNLNSYFNKNDDAAYKLKSGGDGGDDRSRGTDSTYHRNPLWIPPTVAAAAANDDVMIGPGDQRMMESDWSMMKNNNSKQLDQYFYGVEDDDDGEGRVRYQNERGVGGLLPDDDDDVLRHDSFQSNWIVIKNISDNLKEEDMTRMLMGYGPLKSVTFMKETNSVLVCYMNKHHAVLAKHGFDQLDDNANAADHMGERRYHFDKMCAEFVPDWTMTISHSNHHHDNNDGGNHLGGEKSVTNRNENVPYELNAPEPGLGYTTPGGLWIPSKVLQNLDFYNDGDDENGVDDDHDVVVVGGDDEDVVIENGPVSSGNDGGGGDEANQISNELLGDGYHGDGDGGIDCWSMDESLGERGEGVNGRMRKF